MEQEIVYEKLPADIAERFVLLMDPILGSGNSANRAIQVCVAGLAREGGGRASFGQWNLFCCVCIDLPPALTMK